VSAILDDENTVAPGDVEQLIEVGWYAEGMLHQDRPAPRGDSPLDRQRVQIVSSGRNVNEYRGSAEEPDRVRNYYTGKAGDDYLVAGSDRESFKDRAKSRTPLPKRASRGSAYTSGECLLVLF
jgi:hypothetical protein